MYTRCSVSLFTVLSLSACQDSPTLDPTSDVDLAVDEVDAELAAVPGLRIVFAGGGAGEVRVNDASGATLTSCTATCNVPATQGQVLTLAASTPSRFGGLAGACTTSELGCDVTIGAGRARVTATFSPVPGEQWTRLLGGGPLRSAAYDGAGRLIVASDTKITKLSATGVTIWELALGVCSVATGPNNTIYAQSATSVIKLAANGTTTWTRPLDPHAVGCGRDGAGFDGFIHNLAVGRDGAVAIHGDTGVARWDADGNLTWSAAVTSHGIHGVAIDPRGVVAAAVVSPFGETVDLVRFAADGTPLAGQERIASQSRGMFVLDPVGRLLATGSGHSHTDAFGQSVNLPDLDFAPNGICGASSDVGWLYETSDDTNFAREWTLNRYHADRRLASSYTSPIVRVIVDDFGTEEELGTNPHDIAGSLDGQIAVVGAFAGRTYQGGWVVTFGP
jgi:hypothetical protein